MKSFRQYLNEQLRDPEFAREYELVSEEVDLGAQLALRRERIGLTQQQLAARVGIKQPMIARIEHGQTPTLQTLQRLASGLEARLVISSSGIVVEPLHVANNEVCSVVKDAFDHHYQRMLNEQVVITAKAGIRHVSSEIDNETFTYTN